MKYGISTASLFVRKTTEDALQFLSQNKIPVAEVFLESYCEYTDDFANVLLANKGEVDVHSVHVLTTQFEPQLYSINQRAQKDSFDILDSAMNVAKKIGAKYYTFHGPARLKKTPIVLNYDRLGQITQKVIDSCRKHGISLAYENVHWGYYNFIGYFKELKSRTNGLKATLDIKQARQSGLDAIDFIKEMKEDIVTVHISDVDENGKMCLPGKGITDFNKLFSCLGGVGFNGSIILEVYQNDYKDYSELFRSYEYIKNLGEKIFK